MLRCCKQSTQPSHDIRVGSAAGRTIGGVQHDLVCLVVAASKTEGHNLCSTTHHQLLSSGVKHNSSNLTYLQITKIKTLL